MSKSVKKAIIPAAGLGTRFLPATKAQAKEMLERESVDCNPKIVLNEDKINFYDFEVEDVKIVDYPRELIKTKNPNMKFDIGI